MLAKPLWADGREGSHALAGANHVWLLGIGVGGKNAICWPACFVAAASAAAAAHASMGYLLLLRRLLVATWVAFSCPQWCTRRWACSGW